MVMSKPVDKSVDLGLALINVEGSKISLRRRPTTTTETPAANACGLLANCRVVVVQGAKCCDATVQLCRIDASV